MTQKKFYYWLDPIRALSALLVLFVHERAVMFCLYKDLVPSSQNILTQLFYCVCSLGGFAVCMFYILSGFLVGGSTIEKIKHGLIQPKYFFLDRFFRIGVPLTGALILILIVDALLGNNIHWIQFIGQYFGLQVIYFVDLGGVFWTLPYEIWFYALLCSVLLILGKKHILLGSILFGITLIVFTKLHPQFLYILACGVLCYLLKDIKLSQLYLRIISISTVLSFIVYFVVNNNFIASSWIINNTTFLSSASQILLFTFIAILLSQYVNTPPRSNTELIINNIGKRMSKFSYSLFLTHYQVLKLWIAYGKRYEYFSVESITAFVLVTIICIVVAYLFYLLFEKNTQRVQKYCERKLRVIR